MYVLHLSRLMVYKKAGLHCCCSASLALVLPLYPNKQHRSPRRYVRIHARPLDTCDD